MKTAVFALLSILIFLTVGCVQEPATIKIGAIFPLTGPLASVGETMVRGVQMAVDDANARGGIDGKMVQLIIEDSQSDPKSVVIAYRKLRDLNDIHIVTTGTSGHALAIKSLTEQDHVLFIAAAAHPDITKNTSFVLRHANTANEDAATIAQALRQKNYTRVGIIHINDDWGVATEHSLRRLLETTGIVVQSEAHNQGDTDFRTYLTKLSSTDALVDISAGTSAGLIIQQMREIGYSGDFYSGVGFSLTPDAAVIAGTAANGIFYQEYPMHPKFVGDFQKKFGTKPAPFSQATYTGIELVTAALNVTHSEDPAVLIEYLKERGSFEATYENVTIKHDGEVPLQTFITVFHGV